jgi:hypothetical protein
VSVRAMTGRCGYALRSDGGLGHAAGVSPGFCRADVRSPLEARLRDTGVAWVLLLRRRSACSWEGFGGKQWWNERTTPERDWLAEPGWRPGEELTSLEQDMCAKAATSELLDRGEGPFDMAIMEAWPSLPSSCEAPAP